jgi:peptidoglycan hydrolase-like protein with peptidoglycan-binding domain
LRVGSTGEPVKQWQKIVGVSPLTGYYGDYTAKATIAWKGKNGLPTTGPDAGVVTEAAWAKALGIVGPSFAPGVPSEPAFAPPPTPSFAPTPAPATPRQASTTTRQPTTAPKTAPKAQPAKKASTATKTAKVAAASMFDFTKWPAVAQVLGVLTITGGAIAYAFHTNKKL